MTKIDFWKDNKKESIDPALFSSKAEKLAVDIAKDNEHIKTMNKRTQIRKFYDEVVRLDMEAKAREGEWNNIAPLVHMITAKAAYARGRNLISDGFLEFIKHSVGQVNSPKDLSVFANFFEAFMGFYRLYNPKN
ncbi:CRISPR type III-A/MTUBE-associated protein Csm2 [uncultured Desulfobacterium sp.]|uniref:CRISPR system Cms protein Csm2 n=1 Tax=uncultured Desulfobacterium sp. TaxID=201089 RepID=A0A445MUB8_9BACT|nr:CRISPR type III-A/MTUBE-associated protein Csm2 [uncultured Desulfobacterium sp.]